MKNVYFILVTLFLFSCTHKPECNIAETIFYEKKEPFVEVFTISQLRKMEDGTRSRLCNEDYFWSDLKVGNLHIPADVFPKGHCERIFGCFFGKPMTFFKIIDSKRIILNNAIIFIEDLDLLFDKHFTYLDRSDVKKWRKSTIVVNWDSATTNADIEFAIKKIAYAYANYLQKKYIKEGKPFDCEEHFAKIAKSRKPSDDDIVQYGIPVLHNFKLSIEL